jgi:hypothetical protein
MNRSPDRPAVARPGRLRRGPWENGATALIGIGILMMIQPFWLALYSWSFIVILSGTLSFIIVSHLPE